ncbi:MAG: flippase-like domain-containing protein [Endomicrobia bacterium]|nr:flippase-like domain-containing protein [Endomicrobiia bacterium]
MNKYIKLSLGILISIIMLYLVFRKIDIKEVLHSIVNVKISYVVISMIISFFLLYLRSFRWKIMINEYKKYGTKNFFESTVIGLFFNNVLPFRMGDLIQGYMLSKKTNLAKSLTISSVFMERFVDLFPPIIFIIIGSFFVVLPKEISVVLALFVLIFILLGLVIFLKFKKYIIQIIEKISSNNKFFNKVKRFTVNFYSALENFKDVFSMLKVMILTILLWLGYSVNMVLVCFSLDIELPSLFAGILIQAITSLSVAIPSSPGYIGSWEFMGVLALSIFNVAKAKAVSFALLSHILGMSQIIVLGIYFIIREMNIIKNFKEVGYET